MNTELYLSIFNIIFLSKRRETKQKSADKLDLLDQIPGIKLK